MIFLLGVYSCIELPICRPYSSTDIARTAYNVRVYAAVYSAMYFSCDRVHCSLLLRIPPWQAVNID